MIDLGKCPYFATKYDSAAHEVIAILADHAEGYGQDFGGNVDAPTGYFELVILDESHDVDFHDHTNYPPGDYAGEVARRHGVQAGDVMGNWLVLTNAQGFVSVIGHPTPDAARAAFAQLEAQWIDWEGTA